MRIYYGSKELNLSPSAAALGDFDAIHKGHREIINDMMRYAKENKLISVVYMFSSHPNKNFPSINTLKKRLEILENMGVEYCVVEDFTDEYKKTSCEAFVEEYIGKRLNAKAVFVGFNYRFGKNASGDTKMLKNLCGDIKVFEKPCVKIDKIPVSSTVIRGMIEEGDVQRAADFSGRYFSVRGEVVRGKQIGRTIGFPTANMEYPKGTVVPKCGVYITKTKVGENKYYSITNVGAKPTVCDEKNSIETAIGDFSKEIYGEEIEIEFCRYLRNIEKFKSLDALKAQLKRDMEASEKYFRKGEEK